MCSCRGIPLYWYLKVGIAFLLMAQSTILASGTLAQFPLFAPLKIFPLHYGQLVVLGGALIVAFHYWLLRRKNSLIAEPDNLITRGGLYGWIRHPMYLGDFFVIVGLALMFPTPLGLVCIPVAAYSLFKLAQFEDRQLATRFDNQFYEYKRGSRLLIPRIL